MGPENTMASDIEFTNIHISVNTYMHIYHTLPPSYPTSDASLSSASMAACLHILKVKLSR